MTCGVQAAPGGSERMPVSLDSGLAAILPKGATGMKASGKTMSFAPRCADSATALGFVIWIADDIRRG